ncbi:MAG: macro domain-containing protein [Clostridia bacterium]|nr:macro domain-containing protein [Clostridia bacterium]
MPLHIIRHDVTRIECDVIVNPTNPSLYPDDDIDVLIHRMAGPGLIGAIHTYNGIPAGEAVPTAGFKLPCRYVVHAALPDVTIGSLQEVDDVLACCIHALDVSLELGAASIVFPMPDPHLPGCPIELLLPYFCDDFTNWLNDNEADLYLVLPGTVDEDDPVTEGLLEQVSEYIDDRLIIPAVKEKPEGNRADRKSAVEKRRIAAARGGAVMAAKSAPSPCEDVILAEKKPVYKPSFGKTACYAPSQRPYREDADSAMPAMSEPALPSDAPKAETIPALEELLKKMDAGFSLKLQKLIDAKGMTDVECYKSACVSKQTWYKILNDASYRPSKTTVLCFAIALKLSLEEALALLRTAGYTLSRSSKADVIVEYFLSRGIYDLYEIDCTLLKFDQPTLRAYT